MRGPGALQKCYKHPWGSQSNASPILLLPPLVGKLFENDGVAYGHDLMDLFAMQTLAVGSQLAFFDSLLLRDQRDGRWPYIGPDRVASHRVLGLAIRHAFQSQLHPVAVSLGVSRLRLWAAGLALHQADVLDAMIQPVFHGRVVPVDACRELVVFPDEVALVALRWLVQHKAQAAIVAFVLDAGKSSSPAYSLKPYCSRSARKAAVRSCLRGGGSARAACQAGSSRILLLERMFHPLRLERSGGSSPG